MFEIGWTEMLVIAVVMIVVVGPKDLPRMLRTFGRMTTKLRGMAGDFQKQFNDAIKEAELDDVKKSVESLRSLNPTKEIRKQLNPFEKAAADVRAGVDAALKPTPKPEALPETHPAEPLKAGGADMALPVTGPTAMPAAPLFSSDPNASAFSSTASATVPAAEVNRPAEVVAPATATPMPAKAARTSVSGAASRTRPPSAGSAGIDSAPMNGSGANPGGSAVLNGPTGSSNGSSRVADVGAAQSPSQAEARPLPRPRRAKRPVDAPAQLADGAPGDNPAATRPRASRKTVGPLT